MVKVDNKVWGSAEQAKPVVIIGDMVYLHTDITQVEDNLYSYTEHQLTLSEFLTAIFSDIDIEKIIGITEVNN